MNNARNLPRSSITITAIALVCLTGCGLSPNDASQPLPQSTPTPQPTPQPTPAGNPDTNDPTDQPTADPAPSPTPQTPDQPAEETPPALTAAWRHEAGTALSGVLGGLELAFMALEDGGEARLYYNAPATGTHHCYSAQFSELEGDRIEIAIDSPNTDSTTGSGQVFLIRFADADTLELIDEGANTITSFSRAQAIPLENECLEFEVVQEATELVRKPHTHTGLAFDGSSLWYTGEDGRTIHTISGQEANLAAFDSQSLIHAIDDVFWVNCNNCTNPHVARHATPTDVKDVVNDNGIINPTDIRAMAFDLDRNVLWTHGVATREQVRRFQTIKVVGEPDTSLDLVEFDLPILAMTWDRELIWALLGGGAGVIAIDGATFEVVAEYQNPDPNVFWSGIAIVESSFHLIGIDASSGNGVTMTVTDGVQRLPQRPPGRPPVTDATKG